MNNFKVFISKEDGSTIVDAINGLYVDAIDLLINHYHITFNNINILLDMSNLFRGIDITNGDMYTISM